MGLSPDNLFSSSRSSNIRVKSEPYGVNVAQSSGKHSENSEDALYSSNSNYRSRGRGFRGSFRGKRGMSNNYANNGSQDTY